MTAIDLAWRPTATWEHLRRRATILADIREFFAANNILEVETPQLCAATGTDPYIESFQLAGAEPYYLQTSPEYAMKRLLAAGSGPIYQICKAYRQDESGRWHNPEFTMLEWYRPGFNHHQLMQEMDQLLQRVLGTPPAMKWSYHALCHHYLQLDITEATQEDCLGLLQQYPITGVDLATLDRDTTLQLLLHYGIEPQLGFDAPCFIYDFPVSQAALARLRPDNPPVAERFELYIQGIEIANGFHELADPDEQAQRFLAQQAKRRELNCSVPAIDQRFLAALQAGLPDCSGVALGLDRLIMLAVDAQHLQEVIAFPWAMA